MKNVSKYRAKNLWTRYKVTLEQRTAEIKKRKGKCDICRIKVGDRLEIDHHHVTGQRRGYLCHWCNTGLGLFMEDQGILRRAGAYIRRFQNGGL